MTRAQKLLEAYDDLTWENYVDISDSIVRFDKNNIEDELQRQASVYSYYTGLLGMSKKDLDASNLRLTQYIAQTRKDKKNSNLAVKQTAKDLDDFVSSTEEFHMLSDEVNNCQFKFTLLKGLVQALEQKKDMLVQLSANTRAETNLYK